MNEDVKEQFELTHKRIDDNKTLVKTIVSSEFIIEVEENLAR
jgi:hypothetical protein